MKILLQHRKTRLYFQSPGVWTRDPGSAFDFRTSQNAIDFAGAECMAEVQVTAVFLKHPYVECVPFSALPARRPRHPA